MQNIKNTKKFLLSLILVTSCSTSVAFLGTKPQPQSTNQKLKNSIYPEKFILTSTISNSINFDESKAFSFDLSGIMDVSGVRILLKGDNSEMISSHISWKNYSPWDITQPDVPGKNGEVIWSIKDKDLVEFNGSFQIFYTSPGQKSKMIYESENFSVFQKDLNKNSIEILNTKSEHGLLKNAAVFSYDPDSDNPEDFHFLLQNEFGNNQKWTEIKEYKNDKIYVSFKNAINTKTEETNLIKGKIAVIKKTNNFEKTVLVSDIKNFELRKECFLEIKNTQGRINKELKSFAILSVNNKYASNTFTAKIFDENDSEITDWKIKISNGVSGRQVNIVPSYSEESNISRDIKVKIFMDGSTLVEESAIINVVLSDQTKDSIERKNISFDLLDNMFWIENDLNETCDIAKIIIGKNCKISDLSFEIWNVTKNSIENDAEIVIQQTEIANQFTCFFKFVNIKNTYLENSFKINIYSNNNIVKQSGIFNIRKVENTTTNKLEKISVYNLWNNGIERVNSSTTNFKNAFEVYSSSIYSSEKTPWNNFKYEILNKQNEKISYESISFEKIIRAEKCIGWYVSVSLDQNNLNEELKLNIVQNNEIIQSSNYVFLNETNKFINLNEFSTPRIGKSIAFIDFEIPDIEPDFDDVRIELVDKNGKTNNNYIVKIDSSGENTWCSIELSKKEVSQDFLGHINIYANDELICQSNNEEITIHEITGEFSKWEGDTFGFSNRVFDGKITFSKLANYDVTKCDFDLVDKYGKSYLDKNWFMPSKQISDTEIEFSISPPTQFMQDEIQGMKIVAIAYGQIFAESEMFDLEVMHPNLIINPTSKEIPSQFSQKGGIESVKTLKIFDSFILYKNIDLGKNLLEISDKLSVTVNDKVNVNINKENSKNNILSLDFEYNFEDFWYTKTKIDDPTFSEKNNQNLQVHKNTYYKFSQKIQISPKVFYMNDSKIFEMGAMELVVEGIIKESMDFLPVDPIPSYFYSIYKVTSIYTK